MVRTKWTIWTKWTMIRYIEVMDKIIQYGQLWTKSKIWKNHKYGKIIEKSDKMDIIIEKYGQSWTKSKKW